MSTLQIATLLTFHNRKQKTLSCLKSLYDALDQWNRLHTDECPIKMEVYMTDDGSSDGTTEAIGELFPDRAIKILKGNGQLFWAKGMCLAWNAALKEQQQWDYYLLLNDDTYVRQNLFDELFAADKYSLEHFGCRGIYSGITCSPTDERIITYGGDIFTTKAKGRTIRLQPTGVPQTADLTNANILWVHPSVVDAIGIFYQGYKHGCADYDYSLRAKKKQIPTLVTANICGTCERDHHSNKEEIQQLMNMTLRERREFVNSPTHSDSDYLTFVRRNLPTKYPFSYIVRKIRLYCPRLYYLLTNARGVYQESSPAQ